MTIATFKKVTFLGLSKDKSKYLSALQELGCIHLISIKATGKSALNDASATLLDQIKSALRYLKDSPDQARPRLLANNFNPDQVVKEVLENQRALRECIDQHDFLVTRINNLSQWGHFILPAEGALDGIKLWFYKINLKELELIPKDIPIQEVYRDNRYAFIVWLSENEPQSVPFAADRIHTGAIALNALKERLEEINEQRDDLVDQRRNLTRYRYLLSCEVAQFADRTQLNKAHEQILDHEEFCLIQGWLPQLQLPVIEAFCADNQLGIAIENPLAEELPPTLLESKSWLAGGQELVNFYQTPGYHSLDPSVMVLFSFSLFFAMILADAGYGMILGLFTFFSWNYLGKKNVGSWLRPLLLVISFFSIVYGMLLGSYWGVEPKSGTVLAQLKIINIKDFKSMMELVLIVGCIHICSASGLRAWHAHTLYERMQSLGIILLILGAMLLSIALLNHNELIKHISVGLMVFSIFIMMIFASDVPITSVKTGLIRVIKGLGAVAEIPSLFGDILSYLRLFALGLAGASLAITFNTMAQHIAHSSGWVLGGLVLLLGQTMNFVLCLMSAVIHGLRLNYIEFFKWSIKEDGYRYQPFKKEEVRHE
jgi:V/A-type H+-transporting ATPase subunit I